MPDDLHKRATFRAMTEGTAEDWSIIAGEFMPFAQQLPDRVMAHLKLLEGDCGGFPIDRLEHSLQTATRAHRDGRDEEYVVMALLHDIGDTLGSYNHPDIAAAILKPFVSEENHWIVAQHGIFQGYYFFHHLGLDRCAPAPRRVRRAARSRCLRCKVLQRANGVLWRTPRHCRRAVQ